MSFPIAARHCEAHRVELCVGMGCGNLISKNRTRNYLYQQIATSRLNTNQRVAPRNDAS
jgi:hypothetical protein